MRFVHFILIATTSLVAAVSPTAQETTETLPPVIQHAEPVYPIIARQMRVHGDVHVKIITDGESVRDAVAEDGPPLLRQSAETNARTWKFAPHTPGAFHVTFRYKLESCLVVEFLKSPALVEITEACQPEMFIDYVWLDLGKWKAQLKSTHGNSEQEFELKYSGPNEEWLDGTVLSPKGEKEEIDYGHKEGDFLAFTIKLSQPDGQHLKTFLVGKMKGDKITGTFVDDAGITGEWKAVRER
ncbi:MAG: energy transducer TonB [Candidatus Acidiferrales bacterium]